MYKILEKEIVLSELGKIITTELLLTNSNPYLITFVMLLKQDEGSVKVKDLFDKYMSNSIGNVHYLRHIIDEGIACDLIEFKQ